MSVIQVGLYFYFPEDMFLQLQFLNFLLGEGFDDTDELGLSVLGQKDIAICSPSDFLHNL